MQGLLEQNHCITACVCGRLRSLLTHRSSVTREQTEREINMNMHVNMYEYSRLHLPRFRRR